MGGGVGLGCHASHRIVGESSRIAMPEMHHRPRPRRGRKLHPRPRERAAARLRQLDRRDRAQARPRRRDPDRLRRRLRAGGELARPQGPDRRDGRAAGRPSPTARGRHPREHGSGCRRISTGRPRRHRRLPRRGRKRRGNAPRSPRSATTRRSPPPRISNSSAASDPRRRCATRSATEYRYTWRSIAQGDFLEGIRALIIDKDKTPRWRHARIEDVTRRGSRRDARAARGGRTRHSTGRRRA